MKIIDYKLVAYYIEGDMVEEVIEEIKKGWQPLGGVAVCPDMAGNKFAQAMVRYEKDTVVQK